MQIFDLAREHSIIHSTSWLVGWDQETYLPPKAAGYRAKQLAWLSTQGHKLATSDEWKKHLESAEASDDGKDPKITANLREIRRNFDRETKLPSELVARDSETSSLAKHAWSKAREESDFSAFAPHLEKLIGLAQEKAELWGYEGEPYDALLENYERATSTAAVAKLFDTLKPELIEIASKAVEKSASIAPKLPAGPYPVEDQQKLNRLIAESIGFDFEGGRIDTTAHPFCTTLGPHDVRMTTRYDENDFTSSLFGVLHEAGHGMYEQGTPADDFGLPSGSSLSLAIHESQSRLWENQVGRSRELWNKWYPTAQSIFPQLKDYPLDDFMTYLHRAEFTPIRVEADEATYDLHILLRFGLERQLLNGDLKVNEIPEAWNENFKALFGFAPKEDRQGCLQDIHWSMGGLGYFATYSLGNINAAQLFAAANQNSDISTAIGKADYAPLLSWLRKEIHAYGATIDPSDLMKQATGKAPSTADYITHLKSRYL